MDAADNPDDAQLCWTGARVLKQAATGARRPCAPAASSKVIFDIFAPPDSCEDGAACSTALPDSVLPPTAAVFDMAASDASALPCLVGQGYGDQHLQDTPCDPALPDGPPEKKELDDISTPGPHLWPCSQPVPWHDVGDDDVDFSNFRFLRGDGASASHAVFGGTGELEPCKGHADSNSLEHDSQCGILQHDYADCASPLASDGSDADPDESDTLGYDYSPLGPRSDIPAGSKSDSLGYGYTLGHQSDIQRLSQPPQKGTVLGGGTIKNAPAQAGGERCLPVDRPAVASVHVDFQAYARATLPDVFPASEGSLSDGGSDAEVSSDDPPAQDLVGTQCGPLPHAHAEDVFDEDFVCPFGLFDEEPSPLEQVQQASCEGRTCVTTIGYFCAQEELAAAAQATCGPLPQLGTQCGHLPQPSGDTLEDTLDDLKHTLASLATAASSGASIDDRMALLEQYQAASRRFALWDQAQAQSSSLSTSLRTQCGPLPQATTSCSKDFISKTMPSPRTQYGPLPRPQPDLPALVTPRTQTEPLPQATSSCSKDFISKTMPSPRTQSEPLQGAAGTQCGPLPQQQTSVPLEFGPSITQSAADARSKGRKRRGKKTRKP